MIYCWAMILLLSILFGTLQSKCEGLQANLQYQYDYTGTISTWMPSDPTQSSGAAMRAVVALQLSTNGDILVKIDNVHVAEHNGEDTCNEYQHAEFPYREMDPHDAAFLQQPFLVHVNRSQVSYMEVPPEPAWVNNIRRGIINTLPLVVLKGQHSSRLTFGLKEDTMIGSCFNWYSMLKLAGHHMKLENKKQEQIIELDVQREGRTASYKTSKKKGRTSKGPNKSSRKGPQQADRYTVDGIQDTLSLVTRTLDDQQCKDKHFTIKKNGNQESVERTQRSSEGIFLMRGEGAVLRLERAEILGDIVIYTGKSDDEFIRTTSKQVLQLTSVQQIEEIFPISYEPERRALSFSVAEGPRSTIKEKLLGIAPVTQQIENNMAGILEDISVLRNIRHMQGEETPDFLKIFQRLVERMTILSWTEMDNLVTQVAISERDKYIIYQAMFASGRDEGLIPILQKMKNRVFRRDHSLLVFQILQSPITPVTNPVLIPAMLEVVSSMNEDESTTKALSLLNIARLANRLCLNSQTGNLCDPGCDTDFILNSFLPMLSESLYDPEKWKRIVTVQALCALGTPYSISHLQPIIQGTNNDDIDIRINAISCLTNDHLPKTAIEMVFDSLVPLMNNPTEFPDVRNFAFLILTTWQPSLSWWEQVAISTWREKSSQVVSFISSVLHSLSEGSDSRSKSAKKVVHLAKHPHQSEGELFSRSTYIYMDEISKNCQVGVNIKLAWLSSTKSFFPRSVYWQIHFTTVMGTTQREKGFLFTNIFQDYYKNLHPAIREQKKDYEDQELFRDIFVELMEELELIPDHGDQEEPFMIALLSDPLSFLFRLHSDAQSSILFYIIHAQIPVHLRMIDTVLAFPTDLGLPIVVKHEEDIALTFGVNMTREMDVEASHRNIFKVNTLVAWSDGIAAGVGVETSLNVNLLLTISMDKRSGKDVVLFGLSSEQKAKIISLSNVMYTSLTPLYHVVDNLLTSEESDSPILGRRIVWNRRPKEGANLLLTDSGLHLQVKWTCDLEKPEDFTNVIKRMMYTELIYQNFDYKLLVDVENSRTKNIAFIFSFDKKERQQEMYVQETGDYGQQTQDFEDLDIFSQVPDYPSKSSGFDDFGESPNEAVFDRQQHQHSPSFSNHLNRMQELIMPPTGGRVYTTILTIEPQNFTEKYEIAVTVACARGNTIDNEKLSTKIHVAFMRSPMPGIFSDTHLICLDLRMETPFVLPLLPKEVLLEMDLASSFLINFYHGGNCEGAPGMKLEGKLDVSSAAIQNIQSTEKTVSCDRDFQEKTHLIYDQAICTGMWTQDFRNSFKVAETLAVNLMQSLSIFNTRIEDGRPSNEFTAQAILNTKKDEWEVTVSGPKETSVMLVPDLQISPMEGYDAFGYFEKVCHVTNQSVETYDGLTYAFQPPSCWATASIFSNSKTQWLSQEAYNYLQVAVQVRFTDQWEVHLTVPSYAVVIDITRSDIWVNDEPFTGLNEKFVVHRSQDSITVGIGMVVVWVGDTVDIMVSDLYYGSVKGICGNYDGEPMNDMVGPAGCLYTDPVLHTLAWTTNARTSCSRFTLRNEKRSLAQYREGCDKVFFQPTDISQENPMKNCTEWKYDERQLAMGVSCRSKVPHPACRPSCHHAGISTVQLGYSCWAPSPLGQDNVQYGENYQCFSTVSPMAYSTACSNL